MHLIIATDAFQGHMEKLIRKWEKKWYKAHMKGADMTYSPRFREIRLWDMTIKEENLEEVLTDIRGFYQAEWIEGAHDLPLSRSRELVAKLMKPFGLQEITIPEKSSGFREELQEQNGRYWVQIVPIGVLPDPRNEYGDEIE